MPQIKEYTQRVGTPSGISEFTVNPSIEGGSGRAIQKAGAAIGDVGDMLLDIQGAKEASDAAATNSELLKNQTIKLNEQLKTGQIDLDKFSEELDAEVEKGSQGFITKYGEEKYRSSANAIKQSLSMDALKAKAEITSVTIKNNTIKVLDNAQQTLAINPTKFAEVKKQYEQDIRSITVDGKLIDSKVAEKMIGEGYKQLDVAQFRGLIYNTDTDKLPTLKKALESGAFQDRQFADEDFKRLRSEVDAEYRGRISAEKDRVQLIKEQREAAKDNEKNKFLIDRISPEKKFTTMDIARSKVLDPDEKMSLISKIESIATKVDKNSANSIKNDAYRRMLLPDGDPNKIVSENQLFSYTEKLPAQDANWLIGRFTAAKTPQEKTNAKLKATFYDYAKKSLGIDPLTKIVDPKAEAQLSDLINDFETQYAEKVSQGISPAELLTQSGKSSLYPLVNNYRRNLNERLADLTQNMKSGAAKPKPISPTGKQLSPAEYLQMKKQQSQTQKTGE